MVAVKAGSVEGVLRRPDPRISVFLVYGPDTGLVNERARILAERAVDDPHDPFQMIRMDGDDIASDPGRLADEAGTMGLFGGRRAIWVRATSRNIAPAVDAVLKGVLKDTAIVIEGGDLAKTSPLRTLCEKSPLAFALPCYADTGEALGTVVDEAMREAGLSVSRDVRAAIVASLGGDRLATRGELAKLTLYAHGQTEITLDDVDAIMSDVSSLALDAVVDAAFAGNGAELETGSRRLAAEGVHASVVLGAALRHALVLLAARYAVEEGRSPSTVIDGMRGLHFRRKPQVERHLQRWSVASLKPAIAALQDAMLQTRRLSTLDDVVTAKMLLDLARSARR
ncbi:DNA polymerase III subunit delta [Microvirga antarctica]|uniref:DNA polymerase III subunit delta n=1 Tax=Microvirga antarctica TaxID=2819233 RepID=UPI001B31670E|nr:DNA polymerase III subunit delta [Microvirga antarctica]